MFDNSQDGGDNRLKRWSRAHPRLVLWSAGGVVGALILAALLSAHSPGVPMIAPGKKPLPLAETVFNTLSGGVYALSERLDQAKADTRQAEARG